jgi:single-strand DNA-binding protein
MAQIEARNEVVLVGRLAALAEDRELPSGDRLTSWRLVVDRPPSRRTLPAGSRAPTIDTVDCVAWTAGLRKAAGTWAPGDVLSIEGALRRRFWRGSGGPASRYEVEVSKVKRVAKAA